MAEYKTSKESRNKIIEACKELFYLQGYKKTTYVDICKKANSNPGLINYYFKTKKNIAAHIYGEFFMELKESVKKHMLDHYGYYDLQYGTTLEIRLFTELIQKSQYLNNFYYDICIEGVEYDLKIFDEFYRLHVKEYNLPLSEDEVKLILISNIGAGIGIMKRTVEGFITCDPAITFNFRIRAMFNNMGISNERVDEIIKVTKEMFSKMEFELNDYFKLTIK